MPKEALPNCSTVHDLLILIRCLRRRPNSDKTTWLVFPEPDGNRHADFKTIFWRRGISFDFMLGADHSAARTCGLHMALNIDVAIQMKNLLHQLRLFKALLTGTNRVKTKKETLSSGNKILAAFGTTRLTKVASRRSSLASPNIRT